MMVNLKILLKAIKELLKIKPESTEILNNIGNTLKDLGKFEEALDYYIKSLKRLILNLK